MKKKQAFTLVEALISLGLLILLIIIIVGVFPSIKKGIQLSESSAHAASLARNVLENLRQDGFDALSNQSGSRTVSGIKNGAPFTRTFDYTVNVQNQAGNKKLVWVTVSWQEAGGKARQLIDETIVVK